MTEDKNKNMIDRSFENDDNTIVLNNTTEKKTNNKDVRGSFMTSLS